ncbi:MAG: SURF1 family protein [Roseicyclus sp.]
MLRRMMGPLLFGSIGVAVLVSLGVWQMQRLAWKQGVLAEIEARIGDAPVALPETVEPERDRYLPVEATGRLGEAHVRVLVSQRGQGAGYRVISPFETEGRRVLVDRGIMPPEAEPPVHEGAVTVRGNLHWPQEVDQFTPEADPVRNLWYAREVEALAGHLGTEPVMIIARELSVADAPLAPLPVDTSGIPNDHLNYAITWFSLAALWLGMTLHLLWRIRRGSLQRAQGK